MAPSVHSGPQSKSALLDRGVQSTEREGAVKADGAAGDSVGSVGDDDQSRRLEINLLKFCFSDGLSEGGNNRGKEVDD